MIIHNETPVQMAMPAIWTGVFGFADKNKNYSSI